MSLRVCLLTVCAVLPAVAGTQQAAVPSGAPADYSQESYVVLSSLMKVSFQNDGTGTHELTLSVRVQSAAGVQKWGLLILPYDSGEQSIEVAYVRVKKSDGRIVLTPEDNFQDIDSDITRAAPLYSDRREKHIAVKSLAIGDTLEYQARWKTTKPLVQGQFWYEYDFAREFIAPDQRLEVSVPADRTVVVKGPVAPQSVTEDSGMRTYTWKQANLKDAPARKLTADAIDAAWGRLRESDVILSSYQSWQDIGKWYWGLQKERVEPSADVRAKAEDLTKGLTDPTAKIEAIYTFVSQKYRYIGIDFGIGRYRPHAADDILSNNFGDCKDKHTLLASLLQAAGITAYPALISTHRMVDLDAPTPAQFDHVITYVPQGKDGMWLDSTSELAPMGFLTLPLRGKQALVVDESGGRFVGTPEDTPQQGAEHFKLDGTLKDDGALDAQVEISDHNDDAELVLRLAFRRAGEPEWQNLVQRLSQAMGLVGTVSKVEASSAEALHEPFRLSYNYHRDNFPDWGNHRINMPTIPIVLPSGQDQDLDSNGRIYLGPSGRIDSESTIQIPPGYVALLPPTVELVRDYAEYHSIYASTTQSLTVHRSLTVKMREVPPNEQADYARFVQSMRNDVGAYVLTHPVGAPGSPNSLLSGNPVRDLLASLPASQNSEASQFETDGMQAANRGDTHAAMKSLTAAVKADPSFTRAWMRLAVLQAETRQVGDCIFSYHKAIGSAPTQPMPYKALAAYLAGLGRTNDAIEVLQQWLKVDPTDADTFRMIGVAYMKERHYKEAIAPFEEAANLRPTEAAPAARLAEAYLRAGELEKGHAEVAVARKLGPPETILNDISFGLAEAKEDLGDALAYAQEAVKIEESASSQMHLATMTDADLKNESKLAFFWDTLGWVHLRMGHREEAENYLRAAWLDSQYGVIGDHLAQAYDEERKKDQAIETYRLALKALEGRVPFDRQAEIGRRLQELAPGKGFPIAPGELSLVDRLTQMRTVKIPKPVNTRSSAEFFVAIDPGPKVAEVRFVDGAEDLRPADSALSEAAYPLEFPRGSAARIVRRGLLDCRDASGCSFLLLPIDAVTSVK